MTMKIDKPVPARIYRPPIDPLYFSKTSGDKNDGLLTRIKKRGVLRVGYNAEALPFAFFNLNGDLVGYDVFFAHQLARDLGVSLEFIPVENINLRAYLDEGVCDIVMSAVTITADKLGAMNFTKPYMDMKGAFIVKDYRKKDFQTQAYIEERKHLRIAFTPSNSQEERLKIKSYFPNAQQVELSTIRDFFVKEDIADAMLTTDKIGKAWALLSPEFGVAVPEPVMFRYDLGYPVPITKGDYVFLEYLNHWLKLQKTSGTAKQQFSYWILGQTPIRQTPRWSIIHNVLHWVD
jgi:ABC-type amino acid transport substrate-binding protein